MTFELDHSRKTNQQQNKPTTEWDGNPVAPREPERAPAPKSSRPALLAESDYAYAGFWIRALAFVIDSIIIGIMGTIISAIIGVAAALLNHSTGTATPPDLSQYEDQIIIVQFLFSLAYFTVTTGSYRQASLGKRFLGLYVIRSDGSKISYLRALWRILGSYVFSATCLLSLGYLMAGFTKQKTALHDILADTRVVYR